MYIAAIGCFVWSILFFLPTPSMAQTGVQALFEPPTFSQPHGFYSEPFQLTLSSATPNAQIRYTLDSSTPSPSNGTLYSGPIQIAGTTIVRAIAYTSEANKSATLTQSYLFAAQIRNQARGNYNNDPALPNALGSAWPRVFFKPDVNGPYPADYEMDPFIVDHPTYSSKFEAVLKALPSISVVTDSPNLWSETTGIYYNPLGEGAAWERPASIEWIDPNDVTNSFSENSGIRMHGYASRRPYSTAKKSFRVYFKAAYGSPKLDFKIFDDNDAVSKFDRLILRNGGNGIWTWWQYSKRYQATYINDEWVRRAWGEMGHLTSHGTYAHLYLNGVYWGLYNLAERVDEKFTASYLGGNETDYDIIGVEESLRNQIVADAGDLTAYYKVLTLIDNGQLITPSITVTTTPVISTPVSNEAYQQLLPLLDVEDLADYLILNHYGGKTDWPHHNWNAYRKRVGSDTRIKFIPWDNDGMLENPKESNTLLDYPGSPAHLFLRLTTNGEFRQVVADRVYKHFFNNGLLTSQQCITRTNQLAGVIDQAIIGESARWGDYSRNVYTWTLAPSNFGWPAYIHTRDLDAISTDLGGIAPDNKQKNWIQLIADQLTKYCPPRTGTVLAQYKANGWYTDTVLPPTFSQEGGAVPANYKLTISNPNLTGTLGSLGGIYYTTDGSDPRLFGGATSPSASEGGISKTITVAQVTTVKARVRNNDQWSPLHEAIFYPPQPLSNLVINEIHYHPTLPANPPAGVEDNNYEFIELYNNGTTALQLDNLYFLRGFTYHFPLNTTLQAKTFLVLASDAGQFQARYGFAPFGTYRGSLSNNGEGIQLVDGLGNAIDQVDYTDLAPWPTAPDGTGVSLALCNPTQDNLLPGNWNSSTQIDGSPGQANGLNCGGDTNQRPSVSITSPSNGTVYNAGATITLNAKATDADGSILSVQFLLNNSPIQGCLLTEAPYTCTFAPTAGLHSLTAVATDNEHATTTSAAVKVTVNANQRPTVAILQPVNGSTFTAGNTVVIQATAADLDGSLRQVEFLANGSTIDGCVDLTAPYSCSFNPSADLYALTAIATDNLNDSTTSVPVTITVNPAPNQAPTAAIVSPNNGFTWATGTPLTITVNATDTDGTVASVRIDVNNVTLCEDASQPFACVWTPSVTGTVTLRATATDNKGTTSSPSTVTGAVTLPAAENIFIEQNGQVVVEAEHFASKRSASGHDWQPLLNAASPAAEHPTEQGPIEQEAYGFISAEPNNGAYIKSAIESNSPLVRYWLQVESAGKRTVWVRVYAANKDDNTLYVGVDGGVQKRITTAYGAGWTWSKSTIDFATPGIHALSIWMGEDGLTVDRLIATTDKNFKPSGVGPNESSTQPLSFLPPSTLASTLDPTTPPSPVPAITLANLPTNEVVSIGTTLHLQAALQQEGEEIQVRFLINGTPLADCDVTSPPYECSWTPPIGSYTLTAVAYGDEGEVTSQSVEIQVIEANTGLNQKIYLPLALK